jgi:hypothetical protein
MIEIYTIHLNSPISQDDFQRLLQHVSEERKGVFCDTGNMKMPVDPGR